MAHRDKFWHPDLQTLIEMAQHLLAFSLRLSDGPILFMSSKNALILLEIMSEASSSGISIRSPTSCPSFAPLAQRVPIAPFTRCALSPYWLR